MEARSWNVHVDKQTYIGKPVRMPPSRNALSMTLPLTNTSVLNMQVHNVYFIYIYICCSSTVTAC